MEERATETQIEQVVARLTEMGMDVHRSTGVTRTVLGVVGQGRPDAGIIELLDGVHEVLRISEPSGARARRSSAAAPSSRAARRTASRGWARKGCACCATRATPRTCSW
jgi:hypothetical protein